MPLLAPPSINGVFFSWSSISLGANGLAIPGVKAINYKDSLTPGKPRGTSSIWQGHTQGQYEADADIELYRAYHEQFKLSLGGPGFMQVKMIVVVQYFHPSLGVLTDTIIGRVMGNEASNSDSPDASTIKHPIAVLEPILWDGIPGVIDL